METRWRVDKIPILQDNFVFFIHDGRQALVVDPGESSAVSHFLREKNLQLQAILITHHHNDHIGGVAALKEHFACPVYAPLKNKVQIPTADHWVQEGDFLSFGDLQIQVMEMPGHTLGHVVYGLAEQKWLFSGDVLFALGCGRLFEGTPEQMFHSLQRLQALPATTLIFCTHDYFEKNKAFCLHEGFAVADYDSIHPLLLAQEKEFNPFLTAPDATTFAERRQRRNQF
jgi:hydroxyacylglutathione hydrolase